MRDLQESIKKLAGNRLREPKCSAGTALNSSPACSTLKSVCVCVCVYTCVKANLNQVRRSFPLNRWSLSRRELQWYLATSAANTNQQNTGHGFLLEIHPSVSLVSFLPAVLQCPQTQQQQHVTLKSPPTIRAPANSPTSFSLSHTEPQIRCPILIKLGPKTPTWFM